MVQISLKQSELKTALRGLDKKRIEEEVINNQTKWLFNPPFNPWISGAMESTVKLTKRALKTVIKDVEIFFFADHALYTNMSEVESAVNSQPLINVTDNIDDYETLTQNHFLLGRRSNNTPVINNKEVNVTGKRKWKAVQASTNMFWSR